MDVAAAAAAPKKELTEKQKAKYGRYDRIKEELKEMKSTLSPQQKFVAQLNSVRLARGEEAFKAEVERLEKVWAAEQAESASKKAASKAAPKTQKNASKNVPKNASKSATAANVPMPVKKVTKTAKKSAAPALSNEEQLAILQKRIAAKKNAEALYEIIYRKKPTNATRNINNLNEIIAKLVEGISGNAIKANVNAKRKEIAKKGQETKEAKKAAAAAAVSKNPFNEYEVSAVPSAIKNNPFNKF